MADKYERFVASYLRLNGYFTVPNFIVHAGDDPTRVSAGQVGNYTETDILGVRMPYSREVAGALHIANDPLLVNDAVGKPDIVVAEVKSGNENRPNRVWREMAANPSISYIVRFVGLQREDEIPQVAQALATGFRFEDCNCRFRYIVFAKEPNEHYQSRGVTYITFREVITFIVTVRGQSWIEENIGVASIHDQWDDILTTMFAIANRTDCSVQKRVEEIETFLAT